MSSYAEYLKIEDNKELVESEHGFFTYQLIKNEMYIADLYVHPDHSRESHWLYDKMLEIARDKKMEYISGFVWVDPAKSEKVTRSFRVFLGKGFKVVAADKNSVTFVLKIKQGD